MKGNVMHHSLLFKIPDKMFKELTALARKNDMSYAELARFILKEYLASGKTPHPDLDDTGRLQRLANEKLEKDLVLPN